MSERELPAGISPRLLTRGQAASYCQLSTEALNQRCPIKPIRMGNSARTDLYDIKELDRWLDSLGEQAPDLAPREQWLGKLGNEGRRARREAV